MTSTFYISHSGAKGMKWGVRRYQNKDGTLTEAGKKRYARDQRENRGKKKGDKVSTADPNRWVKEDLERSKRITDTSSNVVNELAKSTKPIPKRKKMDLSNMTDQELRDRINRENLEKQYNQLFSKQEPVNKGQKYVSNILEGLGTTLGIASSALGIALAIKELKG